MTTARLLFLLSLMLPLAADAAGQAGAAGGQQAASVPVQDARPAAAGSAAVPAAPLSATPVQETPAAAPVAVPPAAAMPGTMPPPAAGPVAMPASSATGSLLQTLFALVAVLALLAALAWFLKRYGPKPGIGGANLRIVGSLNLGGRERLMVVEIGNQWIVVGASPGRVNALATMPKGDAIEPGATLAPHAPAANSFADWLKQTIEKRK
jgi:flagellar protein FliO/FliZ